jgi:hypothetical protein
VSYDTVQVPHRGTFPNCRTCGRHRLLHERVVVLFSWAFAASWRCSWKRRGACFGRWTRELGERRRFACFAPWHAIQCRLGGLAFCLLCSFFANGVNWGIFPVAHDRFATASGGAEVLRSSRVHNADVQNVHTTIAYVPVSYTHVPSDRTNPSLEPTTARRATPANAANRKIRAFSERRSLRTDACSHVHCTEASPHDPAVSKPGPGPSTLPKNELRTGQSREQALRSPLKDSQQASISLLWLAYPPW